MGATRNSERPNDLGAADLSDPHGFAAQYRAAYPRLALVAAGMIGDRAAAEDIVQDAAIIAFQRIGEFRPGSNFAAWMAEIVRRCALNFRRKTMHRRTYPADPALLSRIERRASGGGGLPAVASDAGEILEHQSSLDDDLVRALQRLSPEARCCLLLRTIEQLTYAEIASLMHMPEGTAMSHVHRSRTALRRALAPEPAGSVSTKEATP